jgi:hypothetical protein
MYCRFTGPEDRLKFACDKISVEVYVADLLMQKNMSDLFLKFACF